PDDAPRRRNSHLARSFGSPVRIWPHSREPGAARPFARWAPSSEIYPAPPGEESLMKRFVYGMLVASTLTACAPAPILVASAPAATPSGEPQTSGLSGDLAIQATDTPTKRGGTWIGAAGESDFMLAGTHDTTLGVWVDVPAASTRSRAPADVALVIDVSGSMAGAKIENARLAARDLIEKLADGDIVSIITFSDDGQKRVPPTA